MEALNTEQRFANVDCLCGCGGQIRVKVPNFIPGHDAKLHSMQNNAAKVARLVNEFGASAEAVLVRYRYDETAARKAIKRELDAPTVEAAKAAKEAAKAEEKENARIAREAEAAKARDAKAAKIAADKLAKSAEKAAEEKAAEAAKAPTTNGAETQTPAMVAATMTPEQRKAKKAEDQKIAKALKDGNVKKAGRALLDAQGIR